MRLIKNIGADRVLDQLGASLQPGALVDVASDGLSLFAFDALSRRLESAGPTRLLMARSPAKARRPLDSDHSPGAAEPDPFAGGLLGDDADRARRNALQARGLAADLAQGLHQAAQLRVVPGRLTQSAIITASAAPGDTPAVPATGVAITGDCSLVRSKIQHCQSDELAVCASSGSGLIPIWNAVRTKSTHRVLQIRDALRHELSGVAQSLGARANRPSLCGGPHDHR